MLYNRFIYLIENHAEALTKSWIQEVKTNACTKSYRNFSDEALHDSVYQIYSRLGYWIKKEESTLEDIAEYFVMLGRERAKQGFKLSEVVYSLILSRVELWNYVSSQGVFEDSLELQRALEFSQRLNYFYDKAIYFTTIGFETQSEEESAVKRKGSIFEAFFSAFRISPSTSPAPK
ncbi:MAG: RsbRD N-terminal domain-containing protein [Chloroherpetonaceae bacterium]|nr:RsbRD N-terminal domain-containing protein [Chloroherpetonaceae bacterium]MCS7212052.1 RsbRD N-terminal domain-containing protein [Chloroherpetonaceae bacterium]MDW8020844.1 RsbRD N-terminal domain-containing protein [Chloroherpetonaceae bacterium]